MRALSIAATGMAAQQTRVEVISNNIANVNTTAYGARRAEFADLHYQILRAAGESASTDGTVVPEGVQLGLGVRTSAVSVDTNQGVLKQTGGDLDIAVEGRGLFEVTLPSGESAYTRDGQFSRSPDGVIVTAQGYPLSGNITVPAEARSVSINAQGQVFASFDGQTQPQQIGQINLVTFINQSGLEPLGDNLYRETPASGQPTVGIPGDQGRGTLRQNYLESSNVDVVSQITELIEAQRGYELNAKVITAVDQILAATNQVR